jgi:hypothetical protein
LEQDLADLNHPVGDDASSREDPMVEIRVAVEDTTRVPKLISRLASLFDRSALSFDPSVREVRIDAEWESRAAMRVVEIVQAWLEEDGVESATLSVGNRSYTLVTSTPLAAGL